MGGTISAPKEPPGVFSVAPEDEVELNWFWQFWQHFLGYSLSLYTIALILLVALQTNTIYMTLKDLMYLVTAYNIASIVALGMHVKYNEIISSRIMNRVMDPLSYYRRIRDERRMLCVVLAASISAVATIDIHWIGQLEPDLNVTADNFRDTGSNTFLHRSLDLQYSLIYSLGIPLILLFGTETKWAFQSSRCASWFGLAGGDEGGLTSEKQMLLSVSTDDSEQYRPLSGSKLN